MIPDRLVVFLHGPVLSWVATRNAQLRPTVTWAFGARVSPASDQITALVPDEIKPAMQGVIPSTIVTCSLLGVPNVTDISQVWYVDPTHVALSYQFFSKTHRNVHENPFAEVIIRDPVTFQEWYLEIQYD